jgi:hypothetical protein
VRGPAITARSSRYLPVLPPRRCEQLNQACPRPTACGAPSPIRPLCNRRGRGVELGRCGLGRPALVSVSASSCSLSGRVELLVIRSASSCGVWASSCSLSGRRRAGASRRRAGASRRRAGSVRSRRRAGCAAPESFRRVRRRTAADRAASSQRSRQTKSLRSRTTGQTVRITLTVHPWFDQTALVLGSRSPSAVWAELPDGRTCHLPLRWTDQIPRPPPRIVDGRQVRLDVESLQLLARWVSDRVGRKLDLADRGDQKGGGGVEDPRRDAAPTVVGKARASRDGLARRRENGGK